MKRTFWSKASGSTYIELWIQRAIRAYFMLSAKRDGKAAARFFRKVLKAQQTQAPRVITVDKNAAYPMAIETLKADETIAGGNVLDLLFWRIRV